MQIIKFHKPQQGLENIISLSRDWKILSTGIYSPPSAITIDKDQNIPQLTAGGSREADIATPTREPAFPPSTESATPAPLGVAIRTPTRSDLSSPRESISSKPGFFSLAI